MAYESINPYTGKSVKTFVEPTNEQLEAKIAKAGSCYETWRKKSYAQCAVIVAKAGGLMRTRVV